MGLFLQTAIIQNCRQNEAERVIRELADNSRFGLMAEECDYMEFDKGVSILFNDHCIGYEKLAETLSKEVKQPVMLLYIYDEDFWGYFLYDNGKEIDFFSPMPDCLGEITEDEYKKFSGNSKLISKYFGVSEDKIKKYLVYWTEELIDDCDSKAYEDDEFGQCNCWQMADFMNKIGYPYEWEW